MEHPSSESDLGWAVPVVRRVAQRMSSRLWNRPASSDLTWVGMATLLDAAARHDPARAPFQAYLIGRLRWAMFDEARRRARREKILGGGLSWASLGEVVRAPRPHDATGDVDEDDDGEPESDGAGDPERAIEEERLRERLRRALGSLPAEARDVLVRHYFGGERLEDLAEDLGISKATATRLHAAGKRLLAARMRGWR